MKKFTDKQNRRRYKLHCKVRNLGYGVDARGRLIFVIEEPQDVLPINELKTSFKYKFQLTF